MRQAEFGLWPGERNKQSLETTRTKRAAICAGQSLAKGRKSSNHDGRERKNARLLMVSIVLVVALGVGRMREVSLELPR